MEFSVQATLLKDETTQHREVGFMTGKPFREDTGFAVLDKPKTGDDLVAIEMVSNNGLITIEEGILLDIEVRLNSVHKVSYFGNSHPSVFRSVSNFFIYTIALTRSTYGFSSGTDILDSFRNYMHGIQFEN